MRNLQLLLVDDEERFLTTTKILLEKRGIETAVAASGEEALKVLSEKRVDVAVVDVKMPGMDGVELMRRLKELEPGVEVIMLTGHATVESAVQCLRLGAFDYVMKPCDLPELVAKVHAALARKRESEEKSRQEDIDEIISHPLAVFRRKRK
jgi:DNA-binding NtrC family response regulator